jgi:pimeloyl-ACP methyl ester carboxylesterase
MKATDTALVAAIPQSERDEFYAARRDAMRKNAPRIIVVPGILGSRIDECRSDDSQCTTIWGTVAATVRQNVDLSVRSDRVYRTDVVEDLFFKDVYGGALDYIRARANSIVSDGSDDPLLTVFHYDWRRSNSDNATLLKQRICDVRARAPNSPIFIVAHSMGGLMTKIWAARYSQAPCSNGKKPEIARIVFVATPHLGSPKTIKAIAEGYDILFDELTGLGRYLSWYERNYLLDAINKAGVSFASLFELLPIRSSEYCRNQKPQLAVAPDPVDGDDDKPVNLFDIETWRRYDLLRRIGAPPVRQVYYDSKLAPLLHQSELLLCEIVDFDPSKVAEVVYVFGREKDDKTYGWFRLRSGVADSIYQSKNVQGDGTVPVDSAENFLISSTRQTREVQADHVSIISSAVVLGIIDEWSIEARKRADLEIGRAKPEYASLLVAETAASGNLIPISLDAQAWSNEDERFAIEINSKALVARGYKPLNVAELASRTPNSIERARLYAVAASNADAPGQRLAWIGEVARSAYDASYFEDAVRSAEFVAATAKTELPATDPAAATLQRQASEVIGWASPRTGDIRLLPTQTVTLSGTVATIDHNNRIVNIKKADGSFEAVDVPPSAKQFDELKVGHKVLITYNNNVSARLKPPGEAPVDTQSGTSTAGQGARPGGTASVQGTMTATIGAINKNASSITFVGANGWKYSRHIIDPTVLDKVKVGDKADITWNTDVAVAVQ